MAQLPQVVADLAEDLKKSLENPSIQLTIPHNDHVLWEGFVTDLTHDPNKVVSICCRSDDQKRGILFHGIPPTNLYFAQEGYFCKVPVYLSQKLAAQNPLLVCNQILFSS